MTKQIQKLINTIRPLYTDSSIQDDMLVALVAPAATLSLILKQLDVKERCSVLVVGDHPRNKIIGGAHYHALDKLWPHPVDIDIYGRHMTQAEEFNFNTSSSSSVTQLEHVDKDKHYDIVFWQDCGASNGLDAASTILIVENALNQGASVFACSNNHLDLSFDNYALKQYGMELCRPTGNPYCIKMQSGAWGNLLTEVRAIEASKVLTHGTMGYIAPRIAHVSPDWEKHLFVPGTIKTPLNLTVHKITDTVSIHLASRSIFRKMDNTWRYRGNFAYCEDLIEAIRNKKLNSKVVETLFTIVILSGLLNDLSEAEFDDDKAPTPENSPLLALLNGIRNEGDHTKAKEFYAHSKELAVGAYNYAFMLSQDGEYQNAIELLIESAEQGFYPSLELAFKILESTGVQVEPNAVQQLEKLYAVALDRLDPSLHKRAMAHTPDKVDFNLVAATCSLNELPKVREAIELIATHGKIKKKDKTLLKHLRTAKV